MSAGTAVSAQAHVRSARMGLRQNALQSPLGIRAQAHVRAAHVKVACAAGRSQNKVRESLGIPLLPAEADAE